MRRSARRILAWPAHGENPYQWQLYGQLRERGWHVIEYSRGRLARLPADVVHLHWPDLVLAERRSWLRPVKAIVFLALLATARARGRAVVWTVHNPFLRAEQSTRWGPLYLRLVSRLCSGLIFLSESHMDAHGGVGRHKPLAVIPQPHYRFVYGEPADAADAKRRLGLDPATKVVGFFGQVRPYKHLEALVSAFSRLEGDGTRLVVAGAFDDSCRELAWSLEGNERVLVFDGHVPDEEVRWLIGAMDVVVLPYRELGNSAVALLSLSYHRPVLAPADARSVRDIGRRAGPGWVTAFQGALGPGDIEQALSATLASEPDLSEYEPTRIGELTHRFLSELASRPRRLSRVRAGRAR